MTRLNFDFARCPGVGFVNDEDPRIIDWRDGCEYYISPEDYK